MKEYTVKDVHRMLALYQVMSLDERVFFISMLLRTCTPAELAAGIADSIAATDEQGRTTE